MINSETSLCVSCLAVDKNGDERKSLSSDYLELRLVFDDGEKITLHKQEKRNLIFDNDAFDPVGAIVIKPTPDTYSSPYVIYFMFGTSGDCTIEKFTMPISDGTWNLFKKRHPGHSIK